MDIKIDNSCILKAKDCKTFDYWNAADWIEQVENAVPNWKTYYVGWDDVDYWVCGRVRNG